jgi:hypothetical protein
MNTWLWNFGRPQPCVGGLSAAKTDNISKKSRLEASKRGRANKLLASDLLLEYAYMIYMIYMVYTMET